MKDRQSLDFSFQQNKSYLSQMIVEQKKLQGKILNEQNLAKEMNLEIDKRTVQFFIERMIITAQKHTESKTQQQKFKRTNQMTQVIRKGLQSQQYLQQETDFIKLFRQQFEGSFEHLKYKKKIVGIKKAKTMIEMLLSKHKHELFDFLYPVDWVNLQIPSYPKIIRNPICIRQIQTKLRNNQYEAFEDFLMDMSRLWNNSLIFNFKNKQMTELTKKLRNSFNQIKNQVLQLKNFANQKLINPQNNQYKFQMLDIDQQIEILRQKVSIKDNKCEYLDYDPNYLLNNEQNPINSNNLFVSQEAKKGKKKDSKKKEKQKIKFQSCQSNVETISKQRVDNLKQHIKDIINLQKRLSNSKRYLAKYLIQKKEQKMNSQKSNYKPSAQNQLIDFDKISYEEFLEIERTVEMYSKLN